MNNSNWTGRAPRTMNQAFGPYASMHRAERRSDKHLWVAAALLCAAVIYMLVV